ncbi:hypothetical protein ACK3SF_03220 [Candidatus Nanosalina sp. VS9-1]|uniref:hypothetical protein n=1 Tax=Candidatus Nanosalina sp. VS9-1 TaxID=3388566 RepID=UPI0039E0F944
MSRDIYDLDESEYRVLDTTSEGPITSEEVIEKLEDPDSEAIAQDDFDDRDYTLRDYFWIEEDQFPRNIRDNKDNLAATAIGLGIFSGGHYIAYQDPSIAKTALVSVPPAMYLSGLRVQEQELGEALMNSVENLTE